MLRKLFSSIRKKFSYPEHAELKVFDEKTGQFHDTQHDQSLRKKPDWVETLSKVEKFRKKETGLFHYARYVNYVNKNDEREIRRLGYYTIGVESHVSYEDAKSRSMSFPGAPPYGSVVNENHYDFDTVDGIGTVMNVETFSDDSWIVEIIEYVERIFLVTKKQKSL
jgi:hypothetical protein